MILSPFLLHLVSVIQMEGKAKGGTARACYVLLFVQFLGALSFTVVLPQAAQLSWALGQDDAFSGALIGAFTQGNCLGRLPMWILIRFRAELWRHARLTLLSLLGLVLLSTATFAAVGFVASRNASTGWGLSWLLLGSRTMSGAGFGACAQLFQYSLNMMIPLEERPEQMSRFAMANMLGIGFGPLVSSAALFFGGEGSFDSISMAQLCIALAAFFAMFLLWPREIEINSELPQLEPTRDDLQKRRLVVCGCLLMSTTRQLVCVALEAGTSLVLERRYGWDLQPIGVVIGLLFLGCIPLKAIHLKFKHKLSPVAWIQLLSYTAIFSSLLLFDFIPDMSLLTLLLADGLMFPTLYLTDGLSVGILQQHVLPRGFCLDANTSMLWFGLMANGIGGFGAWLARKTIQSHGRDSYAVQQLCISCCFLGIFYIAVLPALKALKSHKAKAAQRAPPEAEPAMRWDVTSMSLDDLQAQEECREVTSKRRRQWVQICKSRKLIFAHIPKAAGTSVSDALFFMPGEVPLREHSTWHCTSSAVTWGKLHSTSPTRSQLCGIHSTGS